jgi:hypothetical protein
MKTKNKTIGIVGSRRRNKILDYETLLAKVVVLLEPGDRIVSGGCPKGADNFAEMIAKEKGLTITIHYPDWNKHGKAAGFVRNSRIAEDCDVLIALPHPDRKGGTEDTIKKAGKLGKKVILC